MTTIWIDCLNCDEECLLTLVRTGTHKGEIFGECLDCGWSVETVQNTPKNRLSESQQTQGVKSSDLGVQKGNVL